MGSNTPPADHADPARDALRRLLRQAELEESGGRAARRVMWREGGLPVLALDPSRRLLAQAEEAGAVVLERLSGFRTGRIRAVQVRDADALARFLGEERWADRLPLLQAAVAPSLEGAPGWLAGIGERCLARWARSESPFGLRPDNVDAAREAFQLLRGLADGAHQGGDPRTFSLNTAGRTKALEDRRGPVSMALRTAFSLEEGMSLDDVLEMFGLARFQPVLLMRACIGFGLGRPPATVQPYIGLPPEMADTLQLAGRAPYLLVIENLTTFNRYVREIQDDGFVLYSGGFPSRACRVVAARLAGSADLACHWGDVDTGGARIFAVLEQAVPNLRPHLMTADLARHHGIAGPGDPALAGLAASSSAIAPLATFLSQNQTWRLEQEKLTPERPSPFL